MTPGGARSYLRAARRDRWRLVGIVLGLAGLVVAGGVMHFRFERADLQRRIAEELGAIADLKVRQVTNWRRERLADARTAGQTRLCTRAVAEFLAEPSAGAKRATLLDWFDVLRRNYHYDEIVLFDAQGQARLMVPTDADTAEGMLGGLVQRAPQADDVLETDLHRGERGGIHLGLLVPLRESAGTGPTGGAAGRSEGAFVGSLLLRLNPEQFLYPLVQSWPTPSATAETLLVRREGNEVVFLNELRHRPDTALRLRRPIDDPLLPAARGLRGEYEVDAGLDYRGVPVLAATREVPDVPWVMVAKVDQTEAFAPIRAAAWRNGAIVGALLLIVGLGGAYVWRRRHAALLRRELAHEHEIARLSRLYAALSQINQVIVRATSRDALGGEVCRVLVEFGGFRLAWLGRLEAATQTIVPMSSFGDRGGFLEEIRISTGERQEGANPIARCLREGRPYICNDIQRDPATRPWREAARRRGLRAAVVLPVRAEQSVTVASVLVVYADEPGVFADREMTLLKEAADDLGFGFDHLAQEAALRETAQRLATLVDSAPLAIVVLDRDGRVELWNRAATELFGWTAAEVVGGPLPTIPPDLEDETRRLQEQVWGGTAVANFETRRRRKDGTVVDVSASHAPLRDAQGTVVRTLDMIADITERKRSEDILHQRLELQDQLAKIAATVPGMIYSFRLRPDGSACLPFCTPAVEELWGLQPEDLRDDFSPAFRRFHPDDLRRVWASIQESARTLAPWRDTFRVHHPVRGERWNEGNSQPQREADGSVLWHGFVQDVTERKRADEALRASEETNRVTFEQAAVGLAHVAPDGRWLRVNDRLCAILGYARDELLRLTFQEVTHPDDLAANVQHLERLLAGEISSYSTEKRYVRKDGSVVWGNLAVSLVRAATGEPRHFVSMVEDISARKEVEAKLADQLEELRRWYTVTLEREGRVQELKREVNELCTQMGQSPRYRGTEPGNEAGP